MPRPSLARVLLTACLVFSLIHQSNAWPFGSFRRKLKEQDSNHGVLQAVSADEVLRAASQNLPNDAELQALQVKMLRQQVEQLPTRIENMMSARLAEVLVNQIRSWVIDPTQAAVLNRTLSGRDNPIGSRMVHFMGHDLLMLAPKNDEYVGGHILKTGTPFSPHLLGPLLDLITLRPGSTVVDVGANIGSFTIFFAAATGPQGRVYSFEPQRKMFQVLSANAITNGLLNVYPQHVALSFSASSVAMSSQVPDGQAAGDNIHTAEREGKAVNYGGMSLGKGGETVRSATLDSYNLTGVSLIKIDVQGAEQLVVYGARDTIRRNLPVVVYEMAVGFGLSQDMIDSLNVPQAVQAFNISTFLLSLGYQPMPQQPSPEDVFWLPPNHQMLLSSTGGSAAAAAAAAATQQPATRGV